MNNEELKKLTMNLLRLCEELEGRFVQTKDVKKESDFVLEVKPFADNVRELVRKWSEGSHVWIIQEKPKYISAGQIQSVSEQVEMLSVQVFYHETSRARFMNTLHSVEYVLKSMLLALE